MSDRCGGCQSGKFSYVCGECGYSNRPVDDKRMYRHRYVVRGARDFPFDMLRYDSSFPPKGDDLAYGFGHSDIWEVELEHRSTKRDWQPTNERWRSFGWGVVAGSVQPLLV